jgi:hypothetical protein
MEASIAGPATGKQHDAHGKALSLNLEGSIYGALAEIGAGQEVARWFLSVGAASGTVAKTISTYDKDVSGEIYGAATRYVSKERLLAMLDWEYSRLLESLNAARGQESRAALRTFSDPATHQLVRFYCATSAAGYWGPGGELNICCISPRIANGYVSGGTLRRPLHHAN